MSLRKFSLAILAGWLLICGCDQKKVDPTQQKVTSDDIRRDAGKAIDTVAEYSRQTREEFQKSLDARLKVLDVEISKLRLKGFDLKDQARVGWDQKMAELEIKRDAALANLAEVGRSSAEAWKDVQKDAESAWAELDKALHEASNEF